MTGTGGGRLRRLVPYTAVEASTVLSGTANGITMVAFPWLVLQETGDATAAATIAAVAALPLLLSLLVSGTLVDIVGRRPMSVLADLLSMLSVILVPVLAATTGLDFGLLLVVALLGALFDAPGFTARESMLPEAAAHGRVPLERANAIHEGAYGLAYLLGPGIGGVLIASIGVIATFWATAAAFAVSALLIAVVRIPGGGRPAAHERPRGFWRSTREGFAFLWRDRVLRTVAILSALLIGLWLPVEGVLLPVYFTEQEAPGRLGLLITAMSAGGVVGALGYGAVARRLKRRTAFSVALIGTSLPLVALALLPPYPAMVALGFATGLFFGPVNPITNIAMQERTPNPLRGRVVGAMSSAGYAAGPVGYLLAGPMVEAMGARTAFLVLSVGLLAVCLVGAALPALRGLDDPPRPGAVGGEPSVAAALDPDIRIVEAQGVARSLRDDG
ncbi:MAG: MFS transporter [Candidatus Nanopelagicales bacterium]